MFTHIPCADGRAEISGGGHFGLDSHNVQIHQVVEVKMEYTAICRHKEDNTWYYTNALLS